MIRNEPNRPEANHPAIDLPDVHTLVALFWSEHPWHKRCMRWFLEANRHGWATCPITETGFVRVLSSHGFSAFGPRSEEAIELLRSAANSLTNHHNWPADLPLAAVGSLWPKQLQGLPIASTYLLALAIHHRGRLVTFDQRLRTLIPAGSQAESALLILEP